MSSSTEIGTGSTSRPSARVNSCTKISNFVSEPATGTLGDVDLDGDVDTADALLALRYVMGFVELNEEQLAQAEVTGEGNVSMVDCLLILRKAMELIDFA